MSRAVRGTACACAVALASGFGGCDSAPDSTAPIDTCATGVPRPVTAKQLVRVLRAQGFHARTTRDCVAPESVAHVTNVVDESSDDLDQIEREDGHILCDLLSETGDSRVRRTHYATDTETYVDVFNVSCAIYPDPASESEQVRRLERALRALTQR